jgi:very-short-patch-repair endonuclease
MPPFVEVTLTDRRPRHRPGLVIHHKAAVEQTSKHGLPLTTPLATILDLPPKEAQKAANEALVRKVLTPPALEAAGILGAQPTRSPLENRLLPLIRQARLPEPRVNVWVGPYLVDFLWPEARCVVETDGFAAHGHRLAFERDRARDADLQSRGFTVLRFTDAQIAGEPLLVIARITRVLATEVGSAGLGVC